MLDTNSGDVTAIRLKTNIGTIDIYNIYNDINNNDSLQSMLQAIEKHKPPNDGDERNRPAAQRLESIEIYLLRCERGSVHRYSVEMIVEGG